MSSGGRSFFEVFILVMAFVEQKSRRQSEAPVDPADLRGLVTT
jgi:hypothetical protein